MSVVGILENKAVEVAGNGQAHNLLACGLAGGTDCWPSGFTPKHAVQRIGGLIDERLGIVEVGMEVLESEIAAIAGGIERLHDGGPVGGAI